MVKEFDYIEIEEVLSRVLRHPLLQDTDLETGVQYALDFIAAVGLPKVYKDKLCCVPIHEFRGLLPCDCVQINQIKWGPVMLRSMTDNFNTISGKINSFPSFKTQGRCLYTSFPEGKVDISYKAIPVDGRGFPLLPDNPVFLKALESYIKLEKFTMLFDLGKISRDVYQNAQQNYYVRVAECNNEFIIPSVSEMQSITGMLHQLVPHQNEFYKGFKPMGDKELYRVH